MDALVAPIERVVEATGWFVRTPSLRLLHVRTSEMLRNAVLSHVAATELWPHARAPFFVLEAPVDPGDDRWDVRVDELRFDWQALAASAPAGVTLESLPTTADGTEGLVRFASVLGQCLARRSSAMRQLVIVLAPMWIRGGDDVEALLRATAADVGARWREELAMLVSSPALAAARFVVVETETDHTGALVRSLGERAESIDATPSEHAVRAEMDARLANMRAAPRGSAGVALMGGAGPTVQPPPRVGAPSGAAASGALDPEIMRDVHVAVLAAASAMRSSDVTGALREQRRAVDFCIEHGLAQHAVVNELVLGGYALSGSSAPLARAVFVSARDRAIASGLQSLAVQASMAIAACLAIEGRPHDAALAYIDAARDAERDGATALAIEAHRTCGQLMLSSGDEESAARAFRRAVDVAGASDGRGSSAADAARALAALCRASGLHAQASSLEAQATQLDAPLDAPSSPRA